MSSECEFLSNVGVPPATTGESVRLEAELKEKRATGSATLLNLLNPESYRVDSISNPHASSSGSGIYFEFLLRRAHSRSRVERKY